MFHPFSIALKGWEDDFSNDFTELAKVREDYKVDTLSDPNTIYETLEYWKAKYFELMDEHLLLLKNKLKEYFDKH